MTKKKKTATKKKSTYGVTEAAAVKTFPAPKLPYRPRNPKRYRPAIGLIACGGITQSHLRAYKGAGYRVVALCDLVREKAEKRRDEFYPDADVYTDYRQLLKRDDIEVVDIATHPPERLPLIRDALLAGKHVLSQKPFVLDLDAGQRLVDLAAKQDRRLAVNQNGRWAPHFSWMRHAVARGLVGEPFAAHLAVHWDHGWTAGTPFDDVHHLVLYDFAIHWFDILTQLMHGKTPRRVFATLTHAPGQKPKPPLLGQVLVSYDDAQASLVFDASVRHGHLDTTYVAGTEGTLASSGADIGKQRVTLTTRRGVATPELEGSWFPNGFHGTMAELLCAIEEGREPSNSAAGNLASLALCFAALRSAETGKPQVPGTVKRLRA